MGSITCVKCGDEFDEAVVTRLEFCAACDKLRQEKISNEQMKRLPLALVAGSLAFLAFPLAIFFRGSNASGSYVVTSRGRTTLFSPEAIVGFLILGLIFVGVSTFVYFRYRDSSESKKALSILGDAESTRKSGDK